VSRKEKRRLERQKLNQEEALMLETYQSDMAGYYMDQKKIVEDEKERRGDQRIQYKKDAQIKKYKYRMTQRNQHMSAFRVHKDVNDYSSQICGMKSTDDTIYLYKKKVIAALQFGVLFRLPPTIFWSYLIAKGVRNMKKHGPMDFPIYMGIPMLVFLWFDKFECSLKAFEIGFPAHPQIIEKRRKIINSCCFFAPSMVKYDIEYMHKKIEGIKNNDDLGEKLKEES